VLSDVDFEAGAGSISAIVGPNGAGKTTLLKALVGIVPASGQVLFRGQDVSTWSSVQRSTRMAYVPQRSRLRARLSVHEVVALGRYAARPGVFSSTRGDRRAALDALRRVGAAHLWSRPYPDLSGGEQRLVLIARALATGASTLLLDEPTASLDVKNALELFDLLGSLESEGHCIVVVLHDLDDVKRHARTALLLADGRVRARGALADPEFRRELEQTLEVRLVDDSRLGFER
jgi:iron complex transport system ATP-binding protein